MIKPLQSIILMLFLAGLISEKAFAQFPYAESFMNSTAASINFGGSPTALLTGGNIDANGSGFLRLTSNSGSQKGYAFSSNSFPSSKGISVSFEYNTYGGNGADGICFFLFDASVADANFNIGSYGGGLGYTNISATGLSHAYLGIGLDEFGNFCTTNAGGASGPTRTTKLPNSVTIRGAYNDPNGAYYMLNTVQLSQSTHGFSTIGSTGTTRVTAPGTGYRKAYIDILPDASGVGFNITVKIQHDAVTTPVTVISNYYYSYASPANLKFGYAASTGGSNNYHEIRNTNVTLPAGTTLSTPAQSNQTITTCSNSTGSVNISSGFTTANSPNGAINKASVDLDPATTGIQTSYTVSKGTFTSDGSGNITFTPLNSSVSGTATCNFTVNDNYGATSNTATVTATINAAPSFTVNNPAAVCAPATIDLTAAAVTAGSSGLSLSYYTDAAATVSLSNPSTISSSGTYYIKGTNANSCSLILPVTVTVNPLPTNSNAGSDQTITAAIPASVTLGGNAPANGTGAWSQVSGPTTAVFANAALYNTTASNLSSGSYVFRWTITTSCGTSASDVTINIIGTQTITFAALPAKTYGDANFNASATASSGLSVTYTSSNATVATVDAAGNIHILSAGTTTITASQAGNGNYSVATSVQRNLVVNKAPLTVTADNQTKTYGTANQTLTISYAGFVNAENSTNLTVQPTISTTATAASAVGTYPITVSGATGNNYDFTYVNGVFTINQLSQTLTFNALAVKTYGDADFNASATASSGLNVTYTSSNATVATVDAAGNIHILSAGNTIITANQAGNGSYSAAASVSQTLTVNLAALTISANNVTKIYGAANPALTLSYSGFVNGDTYSSLSTQPTISTTVTVASGIGNYPIVVSGAAAVNYQITYVNGALTVLPASQIIQLSALHKIYGDADFMLSITSSSGLPLTYASGNPAIATVDASGLIHIISAGTVTIFASQPGNGNYVATTNFSQQIIIGKGVLTVRADSVRRAYGSLIPALTVSYSGFVNGDTPASLTTQPTLITTATAASPVGTYPVTVSGAASASYDFIYVNGVLTIGKSPQTIAIGALPEKTYGDADFNLPATASSGLAVSYLSGNPQVATVDAQGKVHILSAGTTKITAFQAGDDNYLAADSVSQNLTVNKALLTVAANNLLKTYGAPVPALTLLYSGFVNGDDASSLLPQPGVTTTATAASAAGTYPITITSAASNNYTYNFTNGTLTVVKAALTITADDKTKPYGAAKPPLTVSYSGFVNGDDSTSLATQPFVTTTAGNSSAAGTYPIVVSGASAANYEITYTGGTLTVTNAMINSLSLLPATLYENRPAGTLAGTLSAVSLDPNAAFTYTLVAGNGSADNNLFSISGNKLIIAQSLDYEKQSAYSVLVRATNQFGLYLDQAFVIQINDVNEAPTLAAVAPQTVCMLPTAQTLILTGITAGPETAQTVTLSVSSSNPALFNALQVSAVAGGKATLSYQLAAAGSAVITVTVQDNGGTANGGTDSFTETFLLSANDLPAALITADKSTQISKGETVTLTASGGTAYSWANTAGIVGSANTAVIQVRPAETTTYQVTVSNASGCTSSKDITISVADDLSMITASNILTPNGDGKNDTWVVKNIDLYPDNTISIFDKAGRKLIEVKHYDNSWDGTFNGAPLTEGTYYYVIDFGPGKALKKGFITILRNR